MKKLLLPFLLLTLFVGQTFSQIKLLDRIEYPEGDYYGHSVYTLSDDEILVRSKREVKKKVYAYNFKVLNKDLKELYETETVFPKELDDYDFYTDKYDYSILRRNYKKGTAKLYNYDFKAKKTNEFSLTFPKKCGVSNFITFGDNAFMWLRTPKKKPNLIRIVNLKSGKFTEIDYNSKDPKKELLFYDISKVGEGNQQELHIVYKYYQDGNRYYLIHRYNKNGKQISAPVNFRVNDKHLLSLSFTKTSDEKHFLVSGSYSKDDDNLPSGIFFAKINMNGILKFIKYKSYDELKNFFDYLPEKKVAKIEKKKAKAAKKGKEFDLEYRVATHNIYENNGKYYYIGEFYFPTYRTECTTTTDANGVSRTNCRQVFDGYQYTHAAIASFDESGHLLWHNTFQMNMYYKPMSVKWFIKPHFHNNGNTDLLYIDAGYVESVTFSKGELTGRKKFDPIDTENENDDIKKVTGNMRFWHDNYLYIYGWQKIKNKQNKGKKKREVYYINIAKYE